MDRRIIHAAVLGGTALAGFGAGWAFCHILARREFDTKLEERVNEEVLIVKQHYERKYAPADNALRAFGSLPGAGVVPGGSPGIRLAPSGDAAPEFEDDADDPDGTDEVDEDLAFSEIRIPDIRDARHPYVITAEEFSEVDPAYQRLAITYYAGDNVLVDDTDDPIRDVLNTVGKIPTDGNFSGITGMADNVRYVRNEKLLVDFEITLDPRSYVDAVLNYGRPHEPGDA